MSNNMNLEQFFRLSVDSDDRKAYNANASDKKIAEVIIDGNSIKGYKAFSFIMEKSYFESPTRSSDGSMPDIQDLPTFLTPHLTIDFSLLFIDDYRTLMKLIRSKNEFVVKCYDPVEDTQVTNRMYFATEQMPKLATIARAIQGSTENSVELFGVQDYTVEMIGTNNLIEPISISYFVNPPKSGLWSGESYVTETRYKNEQVEIGKNAIVKDTNNIKYKISSLTFNDKYVFQGWNTKSNGTGFTYEDGSVYQMANTRNLYAKWAEGAK